MSAKLLDGRGVAEVLREALKPRARAAAARLGRPPRLALVSCAAEASAGSYFRNEKKGCAGLGIEVMERRAADEASLASLLRALSQDPDVDAVVVEMPLPKGFDARRVLENLSAEKDVEGLTALNQGRFYGAKTLAEIERSGAFVPCTALALLRLLRETRGSVAGASAVVLGRSAVVGRPIAHLLTCLDATVTLAHSKTLNLRSVTSRAEILVAAVGKPGLISDSMIKEGAVVLDAGTTWKDGKVAGDVDFPSAVARAGWLSPVPGGVGPVTIAELLNAVVTAAERKA